MNDVNLLTKIENLISKDHIKLISFDIFDTLLERPALLPTDIFFLLKNKADKYFSDDVDFYEVRLIAELEARKLLFEKDNNYGEITLLQIYEYIAAKYSLNKKQMEELIGNEIELESQVLKVRPIGKEIYDLALASNKKIVITSDMYLPKDVLSNILNKNNYKGFSKVYVSSELKKRKDTGELYKEILKEEKISQSELLHIGDNINSDVIIPSSIGILSFHLKRSVDLFFNKKFPHYEIWSDYEKFNPLERIIIGIAANKISDKLIRESNNSIFYDEYFLGYYGLGPLLFSICSYLLGNNEIQHNYKNINFASRDGYLPKKVYDILKGGNNNFLDSKYIYSGRVLNDIAKYNGNLGEYFSSKTNHYDNYSIDNLFNILVQKDFLKDKYTNEWRRDSFYNDDKKSGFTKIKNIINKYGQAIHDQIYKRRENIKSYYRASIDLNNEKRSIIFDVGYSGSVSSTVNKLINGKVDKIYLWETEKNQKIDMQDATKTFLVIGPQEDRYNNPPIDIVLEELFSPIEHSCFDIKKSKNNNFNPVFYREDKFSESMVRSITEIQSGAINYINDVKNILGKFLFFNNLISPSKFLQPLKQSLTSNIDKGIFLLGDIKFPDLYSRNDNKSLTDKIEETNKNFFSRTQFSEVNFIKSNLSKQLKTTTQSIGIHIHVFNIEQIDQFLNRLYKTPFLFDLMISVCSNAHKEIISTVFTTSILPKMRNLYIKILPNRGRDMAPLFVGFKDEQKKYDLVCHLHTKKSSHFGWGNEWTDYLIENLISEESLDNIVQLFEDDNNLGIVFPPIYEGILKFWVENSFSHLGLDDLLDLCDHLLKKMHIEKKLDKNSVFFSVGNMFWYRPTSLKPIFNLNLEYEDFPKEPIGVDGTIAHALERLHSIVAESEGFKTICYINQKSLINNFFENKVINIITKNDPNARFNSLEPVYQDILQNHVKVLIEEFKFFEVFFIVSKLLSKDKGNEIAKEILRKLEIEVIKYAEQNNWTRAEHLKKIDEIKLLVKNKSYSIAEKKIKEALNYEPTNIECLNMLTKIFIERNDIKEARYLNAIVISISSDNELGKRYWYYLSNKYRNNEADNQTKIKNEPRKVTNSVVSVIIPASNNWAFTKAALESIKSFIDEETFELRIIDNGSTDKTINLKNYKSFDFFYLRNEANMGFPKAVNQGINDSIGEYIIIANNDIIVTQNWLTRLIEVAESDSNIGIVGPISNYVSGAQLDKNANYKSIEEMHKYAASVAKENKGKITEFPRVAFLCTLIKKEVIDKIGGLDERFSPGNFEDDDFCLRAQLAGYKTVIAHDVFIHHYGSKSFKADGDKAYDERIEKNRQIFINKWGADPNEIWIEGKQIKSRNISYPVNENLFVQSISRALIHSEENDLELALSEYKNSIQYFTQFSRDEFEVLSLEDIYHAAGTIALNLGNLEEANEMFKSLLEINETSDIACFGLAETFFQAEMYPESKQMIEWAVKYNPEKEEYINKLVQINSKLNLPEDDFSLKDDNSELKILKEAENAIENEDLETAKTLLNSLVEENPQNLDALNNLAVVNIMENKIEDAIKLINRILELDSTNETAIGNFKYIEENFIND